MVVLPLYLGHEGGHDHELLAKVGSVVGGQAHVSLVARSLHLNVQCWVRGQEQPMGQTMV